MRVHAQSKKASMTLSLTEPSVFGLVNKLMTLGNQVFMICSSAVSHSAARSLCNTLPSTGPKALNKNHVQLCSTARVLALLMFSAFTYLYPVRSTKAIEENVVCPISKTVCIMGCRMCKFALISFRLVTKFSRRVWENSRILQKKIIFQKCQRNSLNGFIFNAYKSYVARKHSLKWKRRLLFWSRFFTFWILQE